MQFRLGQNLARRLLQVPSCDFSPRLTYSTAPSNKKPPPPSGHQPGGLGERMSFFPFLFLFLAGSGSYVLLVKQRANQSQQPISGATQKTGRYQH